MPLIFIKMEKILRQSDPAGHYEEAFRLLVESLGVTGETLDQVEKEDGLDEDYLPPSFRQFFFHQNNILNAVADLIDRDASHEYTL